jgi:hypothetical protein
VDVRDRLEAGLPQVVVPGDCGRPKSSKQRPIGESTGGLWGLMADPEPPTRELVAALRALAAALEEAGWEQVGTGGRWYALRFPWRGSGEPQPVEPAGDGPAGAER